MKKQILVADEDQLILYALAKVLNNDGCEVKTAATATTAIEKLSHHSYDLCFFDVHLTDSNGQGLMKMIQDICPETKIILMAASYLDSPELSEDTFEAITNESCHFIPKPFDLSEVTEIVHQVLTGEESFFTGHRFTSNGSEEKSRRTPRESFNKNISFRLSVICQGANTRQCIEAQTVDISDNGIGFLTPYPLQESQVIGFDEKIKSRTGVVAWSKMIDEENCRVGVKFA
jgi:CheY-like chemotaxis protein